MLGAITGDIVGSRFEWDNIKTKDFELFDNLECDFTDDSVMTVTVAQALLEYKKNGGDLSKIAIRRMKAMGQKHPDRWYSLHFADWLLEENPQPYNSCGNGAAMRVSPCGWAGKDLDEVKRLAKAVTKISHNHPEGLKGAEATAVAVFLARSGKTKADIKRRIQENYYSLDFTLDEIRDEYSYDETCQGTVPQAIAAFLEASSFEDAIRGAVSLGGDSDTLAAITGGIAEAFYGVPEGIYYHSLGFLDEEMRRTVAEFTKVFMKQGSA